MAVVETYEDGWDCVPELKSIAQEIDRIQHYKYEIECCVRHSDLETMVQDIEETIVNIQHHLGQIDYYKEYKTVENHE